MDRARMAGAPNLTLEAAGYELLVLDPDLLRVPGLDMLRQLDGRPKLRSIPIPAVEP